MVKRTVVAGLLGGVVLIASWIVLLATLPFYEDMALREVPDELPFYEILKERITEPGRYIVLHDLYDDPELEANFRSGPLYIIQYAGGGHESGIGAFLFMLLLYLAAPTLVSFMLSRASEQVLARYSRRVLFVAGFGVLIPIYGFFPGMGMADSPPSYVALMAAHTLITWTLAGMVIAWIVRGPESASGATTSAAL